MKITVNHASQLRDEFHRYGRADQFTYDGLAVLFDYLEEVDPDYELDVVGLCCDYYEDTAEAIAANYSLPIEEKSDGEILDMVLEYLHDNSTVVGQTDSTIVYQCF